MNGPLFGKTILVTRPSHQAASLADPLRALGAETILLPAIEIALPLDAAPLDEALTDLDRYDWVAFTSANGVEAVRTRMAELGIDSSAMNALRLAAVGPATASVVTEAFRFPDLLPESYLSEGFAEAFGEVAGKRILLPRADQARKVLADRLRSAGAIVDEIDAYRILPTVVTAPLPERAPDVILFASGSAVRSTVDLLTQNGRGAWLDRAEIGCLGPIVAAAVAELGLTVAFVAEESTIPGLIDALVARTVSAPVQESARA